MANKIMDLVLRVFGDSGQFREDMLQDKAVLDDLLMSMNEKDIKILLEDGEAEAKLDFLKYTLSEIQKTHALIKVDDKLAQDEVDKLKLKLDTLVERVLRLSLDDENVKTKLRDVAVDLEKIRELYARIPLRVEDTRAKEKIDAIRMDIDTLHDKTVDVKVRTTDQNGKPLGGKGKNAGILGASIMALLPVISPLAGAALGGLGGLADMFGTAGAGAMGFGIVSGSVIKKAITDMQALKTAQDNVNKAEQAVNAAQTYQARLAAIQNLTKAEQALAAANSNVDATERGAINAIRSFQSYWSGYTNSFKPQVLGAFTAALKVLEDLLTGMHPVIAAAGNAIISLLKEMDSGLKNKDATTFFSWLAKNTGPAIMAIGKSIGNLAIGFADLMMAFTPIMKMMEPGLVNLTKRFRTWADAMNDKGGIKPFIAYFKETGPTVLKVLGDLAGAIVHIVIAMAPLGMAILKVLDVAAMLINWLARGHGAFLQIGVSVLQTIGIFKLLAPLFRSIGGPWGLLISLIIEGVLLVIGHWKQIKKIAEEVWAYVVASTKSAVASLQQHWQYLEANIRKLWDNIKTTFRTGIHDAIQFVMNAINGLRTFFTTIANEAITWGENIINSIAHGIENAAMSVFRAAQKVAQHIKSLLGFGSPTKEGPGSTADRWMPNLMNMLVDGINAGIPAVHAALSRVIIPPASAQMIATAGALGSSAISHQFTWNQHAPIYGVEDLNAAIEAGVQSGLSAFVGGVKTSARAMGVSR